MKKISSPGPKWICLAIVMAVIAAGIIVLLTAGFGAAPAAEGGWQLTARISESFNFDESSREDVHSYLLSFFSPSSMLRTGEYADYHYEYVTILSPAPIEMNTQEFIETVNSEYEGLLVEDWTDIHYLQPSYGSTDIMLVLIIGAALIIIAFVIALIAVDLKSALLVSAGMLINSALSLALLVLLRIPLSFIVLSTIGIAVVFGLVQSVLMLGSLNSALSASKRADPQKIISDVVSRMMKNACFFSVLASLSIAVFVIFGLFFRANPSWYLYGVALMIALLIPNLYPNFILPGFYSTK